jgi:hypothetical protein
MKRLVVMGGMIGALTLVQVFCVGMFIGRETKVCQLQAGNQRQLSPARTRRQLPYPSSRSGALD